jgi:hypothetical protein
MFCTRLQVKRLKCILPTLAITIFCDVTVHFLVDIYDFLDKYAASFFSAEKWD